MKKCDICQERPGIHKVNRIDESGNITELNLCEKCAQEKGIIGIKELKTILEILEELKKKVREEDTKLVCPNCQLTFANFKAMGRFGCEVCYSAFREKLLPIIKELHHADRHTGKKIGDTQKPEKKVILKELRKALKEAVENEDYERAASIRNAMKKYE